jgi:hypothetical protein|tara:strand:+ start:1505 stop:1741 length:237 start_codon:yes stop_codon:yes gene_type:complete
MSNTYDIELKMNYCGYGGLNKEEKIKEIRYNKDQFAKWSSNILNKFDAAVDGVDDWIEVDENCEPFDPKRDGENLING